VIESNQKEARFVGFAPQAVILLLSSTAKRVFGVHIAIRTRRDAFALEPSCVGLGALSRAFCRHVCLLSLRARGWSHNQIFKPLGCTPGKRLDSPRNPSADRPRFSSRPACVCTRIFSNPRLILLPSPPTPTQGPFCFYATPHRFDCQPASLLRG